MTITKGSLKGQEILIEDTWEAVTGKTLNNSSTTNPAVFQYCIRSGKDNLPFNDNVYYGKINGLGYIVHESEL